MTSEILDFLIVDDDPVLAQVLERALTRRGFTTKASHTAEAALAIADTHHIDRVLLDLKLAEDSGLILLRELKQQQPALKVVVLTGYSSIATAVEAIKLGALNYLCKPADTDAILAAFEQQEAIPEVDISSNPPSVNRLEWEHIQRVLQEHQGNISATARSLGMHRRTLQRKLQKRPVKH